MQLQSCMLLLTITIHDIALHKKNAFRCPGFYMSPSLVSTTVTALDKELVKISLEIVGSPDLP